jgi:hypothetical protein
MTLILPSLNGITQLIFIQHTLKDHSAMHSIDIGYLPRRNTNQFLRHDCLALLAAAP